MSIDGWLSRGVVIEGWLSRGGYRGVVTNMILFPTPQNTSELSLCTKCYNINKYVSTNFLQTIRVFVEFIDLCFLHSRLIGWSIWTTSCQFPSHQMKTLCPSRWTSWTSWACWWSSSNAEARGMSQKSEIPIVRHVTWCGEHDLCLVTQTLINRRKIRQPHCYTLTALTLTFPPPDMTSIGSFLGCWLTMSSGGSLWV